MIESSTPALRLAARISTALTARHNLLGTFIKSPLAIQVELLAGLGLDFVVLDVEHAPFDLRTIDAAVVSGLAVDLPVLVRLPADAPELIGACLDLGAAGIIAAHVRNRKDAAALAARAHFRNGMRGASTSVRAAGFGRLDLQTFMSDSDAAISLWAQIEDRDAIEEAAAIAAVPGIQCLFVGRLDLAAIFNTGGIEDSQVVAATTSVLNAARAAGVSGAVHSTNAADAQAQHEAGANVVVLGSDQALMRAAVRTLTTEVLRQRKP